MKVQTKINEPYFLENTGGIMQLMPPAFCYLRFQFATGDALL